MKTKKLIRLIEEGIPLAVGITGLVVAIVLTSVNVFTRYIFQYTYAGTSEIISTAFAWMIFCATAVAYKRRMHYGVDMIVKLLPPGAQKAFEAAAHVVMMAVFAYGTRLSWILATNAWTKLMPATRYSYFYFYVSAAVGFGLMTIYTAEFIVFDAMKLFGRAKMGEDK